MVIDAKGQACPKPVLMAEEALSKISEGIVEILVDMRHLLQISQDSQKRMPFI